MSNTNVNAPFQNCDSVFNLDDKPETAPVQMVGVNFDNSQFTRGFANQAMLLQYLANQGVGVTEVSVVR